MKISNYARPGSAATAAPGTPGSTGGTLGTVTDGTTTVSPVTEIDVSGGTVNDLGGGVAQIVTAGASFATPAIVLGAAAAAGAASTVIRSDSTIAAFDGTAPSTQAIGDTAATGSAAFAARRDHKHAITNPLTTQDDLWIGGASGAPARLGKGSDGQVLTVDPTTHHLVWATPGSGSSPLTTKGDIWGYSTVDARIPVGSNTWVLTADSSQALGVKWAAPSGGGGGALVLLEQHTASSSATLDFTTGISSTYDTYEFDVLALIPATANVDFQLQASTDGGSTWLAGTTYRFSMQRWWDAGGGSASGTSSGTSTMSLTGYTPGLVDNVTSEGGYSGTLRLFNPGSTASWKTVSLLGAAFHEAGGNSGAFSGSGQIQTTSAVNAIRFKFSSGNITSGVIRMYGVAKS